MKLDDLKVGLFGYKKASVYQYIASMEEEFSLKLMEKDSQIKNTEEQYQTRLRQLEGELTEIKNLYESQKNQQMVIASTLLEAKRYAETLKIQAETKMNEELKQWEASLEEKNHELDKYLMKINNIRSLLEKEFGDMDEGLQEIEEQIVAVKENSPGINMSLFERKKASNE